MDHTILDQLIINRNNSFINQILIDPIILYLTSERQGLIYDHSILGQLTINKNN